MTEKTKDQVAYLDKYRNELDKLIEASADDAMLFSRMFKQGPDPWAIIQVLPTIVGDLADYLVIDDERRVRSAITKAHFMGPAVLLSEDGGIPRSGANMDIFEWPEAHQLEGIWLFLAECSRCVEAGYDSDTTFIERQTQLVAACLDAQRTVDTNDGLSAFMVIRYLKDLLADFEFEAVEGGVVSKCLKGSPDRGFYAGYKQGHHVVAVDDGGLRFWGTDTSITLKEAAIEVDKQISPYFGVVFHKEEGK